MPIYDMKEIARDRGLEISFDYIDKLKKVVVLMKINNLIPSQVIKTYTTNKKSEGVSKKQDSYNQDSAEISQKAKDLQELLSRASEYPDIRMGNVMAIKERLDKYEIDLDQLADNIVKEMFESKIIKGQGIA